MTLLTNDDATAGQTPNTPDPFGFEDGSAFAERRRDRIASLAQALKDYIERQTDFSVCLAPWLTELEWRGSTRTLQDAVGPGLREMGLTDLLSILRRLEFTPGLQSIRPNDLVSTLPALWIRGNGSAVLVKAVDDTGMTIFNPELGGDTVLPLPRGKMKIISVWEEETSERPRRQGWFADRMRPHRKLLRLTLLLSLFINLFGLAVPLFVMAVYDRIVASGDRDALLYLTVGAVIAVTADFVFRWVRARMMSRVGTRIGYDIGNMIFKRLLDLPPSLLARTGVSAQLARIRDLEQVRSVVSGPLAVSLLELPFILVFAVTIALVAGWLVLVPLLACLILAVAGWAYARAISRHSLNSARANARRQALTLEAFGAMRAIKVAGAEETWLERFKTLTRQSAEGNFGHSRIVARAQSFAHLLTMLTVLVMLGGGIDQVLSGSMTAGSLIAMMMLSWRVLLPMQSAFVSSTRIGQMQSSVRQIDSLMGMPGERQAAPNRAPLDRVMGEIVFDQVSFRYGPNDRPAASGLSFTAAPGEIVAIVGSNGAGKSTILNLIAGMYRPQGGAIRLDGQDLRQFDPVELRNCFSFAWQSPTLFSGTVADNLRLVEPAASDEQLNAALELAGGLEAVQRLPDGLETRIDSREGIPESLIGRLSLARVYLRKSPVILLDEPAGGFDFEAEYMFVAALQRLRGDSTIFVITHRPSHMRLADKVLILKDSAVRYFGPPENVVDMLTKAYT